MVKQLIALALLGAGGWYVLGRQAPARAFGDTGIPYRPDYSLGAFDDWGGIPLSREEMDRRGELELDDGSLDLNLGWLTDGWLTDTPGSTGIDWTSSDWSIFDMTDPRGIRNNNPGNIEYTGTRWQGLDDPPSDGRFARFVDPLYGIRAMSRILDTYRDKYGLNTVQSIISRWAPAHENDTRNYARYVADQVGVDQMQTLNASHRAPVIAAMIAMENGTQPYGMDTIQQGISMA